MNIEDLQNGDAVYAAFAIINDGSVPDAAAEERFAEAGTRGMLINRGHLEEDPARELYLVAFENSAGELGPPVGCWPEELACEPPTGA